MSLWQRDISNMRLKIDAVPIVGSWMVIFSLYTGDMEHVALLRETITIHSEDLKAADVLHLVEELAMRVGELTP